MSKYSAKQAYDNAQLNANNVITYAKNLEVNNKDLSLALQSIGYALHALARGLKEDD